MRATTLGIVVVLLISAIVVTLIASGYVEQGQVESTHNSLKSLSGGIMMYKALNGGPPPDLESLLVEDETTGLGPFVNSEKFFRDGWGRKIRYVTDGKTVKLVSAGKDGRFDTKDDIAQ